LVIIKGVIGNIVIVSEIFLRGIWFGGSLHKKYPKVIFRGMIENKKVM